MRDASPSWDVLLDAKAVAAAVDSVARAMGRVLAGGEVVLLPVLDGALYFAADLLRALDGEVSVVGYGAVVASSYGPRPDGGFGPRGAPEVRAFPSPDLLRDRVAVVVDTVVDTGRTAAAVMTRAREAGAADVRLACLVDKPARRAAGVRPDWRGTTAPDRFLVGYGLDAGGRHRTLPCVAALSERGA
jgi:hypoxanthine phosphoribosyltransferase